MAGGATALTVDTNNRQLHPDEIARIKQLAGGDAVKEARLTVAACALVKCYAEFPEASASYQQLKQLADAGDGREYASERQLLSKQTEMFVYTTGGLSSDSTINGVKQFNNSYQATARVLGAGKAVIGGLGIVGAVATAPASCATGIGCFANAALGTISLDAAYSGAKQSISGRPEDTFLNKGFQSLGMSPNAAAIMEAGFGIGAVAAGASPATKAVEQRLAYSKLSKGSYESFKTTGMVVTPAVLQTPEAQSLIKEIIAGSPGTAATTAENYAATYLSSGTQMPKMGLAASGAEMIKVVPKGDGVSDTSGFWMSQQQARQVAAMSPEQAGQMLGLPAYQAAKMLENGLDFYSISVKSGTTAKVFVSEVAGTAQGAVRSPGGAQ